MTRQSSAGGASSRTDSSQGKTIVVFSDGTGNSSAKFFKTNVWRLYQAIDVGAPSDPDTPEQLVYYDDGVGTSSFKPVALLGGAFGVGLKRNVLDLYRFICRHYEDGDKIYGFGFSRGAYTIRVLVGLIAMLGVVKTDNETYLRLLSEDAYRRFRRCFRLLGDRHMDGGEEATQRGLTDIFVTPLRNWRDRRIARRRKRAGLPVLQDGDLVSVDRIQFMGVWDTVAAYGSPIAEITKGIDRWIWPLSMPDYKLSEKVLNARHALALDDERDTFHPLLWDEVHEERLVQTGMVSENRLKQVWFAGMHSDVGGGYSDDALAYVSLTWMAEEAVRAGLRLRADSLKVFRESANALGPMHDSRAGLGSYYRYQPRKLAARMDPPDSLSRIVQDPDMKGRGLLKCVRIHESVLKRIRVGTDGYAPIVLPPAYVVEGSARLEQLPNERSIAQERVWDGVWRRRLHYFLSLAVTLCLVLYPWLATASSACVGPQCMIVPVLGAIQAILPTHFEPWLESFAARPGPFLALLAVLLTLSALTKSVEHRSRELMRSLLRASARNDSAQLEDVATQSTRVRRIRSSPSYQSFMRGIKWTIGPMIAAASLYFAMFVLLGMLVVAAVGGVHRIHMLYMERTNGYCAEYASQDERFSTDALCWRSGVEVEKGARYRIRFRVEKPWRDGHIAASPLGFSSEKLDPWLRLPGFMLRRAMTEPWFRPLAAVEGTSRWRGATLVPLELTAAVVNPDLYIAEFVAPADGELTIAVNDAVFLWGGDPAFFYRSEKGRNLGTARIKVEKIDGGSDENDREARAPPGAPASSTL